ncbi:amidohydrolase family protein [Sphingosinicella terrae]|uniref:amidohydrolase family protein n=1 Tax=Sphingosinicella terrae TaxID=2172047 RepID=UPI0025481642|nr:amidohydrolase family protein [Sphingosinicella terrae]
MTDRKAAATHRLRRWTGRFAAAGLAALAPLPAPAQAPALEPPASRYQPLPRRDLLLTGATILDGAGGRLTGDILVRDGRIAAVGPRLPRPEGVEIVAADGRWITPGLIDIHTHYGTYLLPQTRGEAEVSDVIESSDPNVADTWIEHAVRPADPAFSHALRSGVTTLQILPGSGALFGGRSVVVHPVPAVTLAQMRFPGAPQGLKMACGGNPASSFGGRGRAPNSRQGEIALIRRTLIDAQRLAGRRAAHRRSDGDRGRQGRRGRRDGGGPPGGHERDLRLETLADAIEGRLPVHLHCYRAEDIATWIEVLGEFGLRVAAVHHATEAYKIAPLLADAGVCAAVWPDWWGFKREAEDGIRENAAFVDAAGGCAILHSDIPVLGSLLNIEAAKAAAAGRRAGLDIPPERAIRWITSNPAGTLGLGDRIGRLAPGFNADLVVWSGDPFSIYSRADLVLIDGAVAHDRANPSPRNVPDFELGREGAWQ